MVELIDSIKSNPIVYYVGLLIGLALLSLVIALIVRNNNKKKEIIKQKEEEKARIERHVDLETMIAKMQEQEQNKLKDVDPVANFEQEQEEKAIISYQELVNAVKTENKEPINVINVSSTGDVLSTTNVARVDENLDKPIFIDEINLPKSEIEFDPQEEIVVEPSVNKNIISEEISEQPKSFTKEFNADFFEQLTVQQEPKKEEKDLFREIKEIDDKKELNKPEPYKFKNSEFISPIYGRQNSNITYPKISSFKNEVNDDEVINISSDVDPNDEFLKTLREFRNN